MSTPLVWIAFPILVGIVMIFLGHWKKGVVIAGTIVSIGLVLAARFVPIDEIIILGPWSFSLAGRVSLGGLEFVLLEADRSLLVTLYSATAFMLAGSWAARTQRLFVPLGLIVIATLIAGLSVEPINYGALFFPLSILLCVLILAPPGSEIDKGLLRFLVFQIIGLAFILLSGWALSDSGNILDDPDALIRAIVILGIGFVSVFAIFPLYTWVIMIAEGSHPYTAVFVFSMVFGSYTLYFLSFLGQNQWLLEATSILAIIRFAGVLMVATGGAWAAFQRNLGRLLGYAVVIEVGLSLITIGIPNGDLHYAMLVPRILALSVWGLGLSMLQPHAENFQFRSVQGIARQFPVASSAVLLAHFSLAGLPLLAGFPVLSSLWVQLAAISVPNVVWCFLGSVGLMVGGFRSLSVMVMGPEVLPVGEREGLIQWIFLMIGIFGLFLFGFFPQWIYPLFSDLVGSLGFFSP